MRWIVHAGGMRHSVEWVPVSDVTLNYPDGQLLIVRRPDD